MKIALGKTEKGREVKLDIDTLLRTRLLIQANSGGGKSWLLRRLAEQLFGRVPVLMIDPEGEFATLRERFGYVLVGKGGETPADPRSAALVAVRLLELQASAVCDLYEMRPPDRHRWVRLFLEALVDAPKKLWRPTIIVVDEAHQFAPEKGHGDSETADAMIGLATRGRKRGFAAVFATQRLGKLRKDVAAELLNVLIGQTFIDIDRKRAAEAIGIPAKDQRQFFDQIKVMAPGTFWALGRAVATERVLLHVGSIQTTHPEPGSTKHAATPPPLPAKVKALLPKLQDLPKEAEEKARTVAELKAHIVDLRRELASSKRAVPGKAEVKTVKGVSKEEIRRVESLMASIRSWASRIEKASDRLSMTSVAIGAEGSRLSAALASSRIEAGNFDPSKGKLWSRSVGPVVEKPSPQPAARFPKTDVALPPGEQAVLTAAAQYPGGVAREQLSVLTGYKRSSRDAYIHRLREKGLISVSGDALLATPDGISALGDGFAPLPTGVELQEYWMRKLPVGERATLQILLDAYPNEVTKEALSDKTGYKRSSRDAYLHRLRSRQLVVEAGRGSVKASEILFA